MANSFQKLADVLNIETARISGDPRRLQIASQMQEQKELKQATAQSEAEINKAIDASNLPESQKRLLKAMDLASKTKVLYDAQTQKPLTEKQQYDELAAQIKTVIANEGRGSDKFNKDRGGNPNLLEFYDDYIKTSKPSFFESFYDKPSNLPEGTTDTGRKTSDGKKIVTKDGKEFVFSG
tara:strand:+ start:533 stop:1072 length:540 start_codon:yes stop_codon:yes gene_type:complete